MPSIVEWYLENAFSFDIFWSRPLALILSLLFSFSNSSRKDVKDLFEILSIYSLAFPVVSDFKIASILFGFVFCLSSNSINCSASSTTSACTSLSKSGVSFLTCCILSSFSINSFSAFVLYYQLSTHFLNNQTVILFYLINSF